MAKLHRASERVAVFNCPGCGYGHNVAVTGPEPVWQWNGSIDAPTLSPSILVFKDNPEMRCHSFVKDGNIQFLSDCAHDLKGKTVELPDWDEQ
jgi:hypothetical protein